MALCNTTNSYGSIAKFFHWTVSPLVILMLAVGFFMGDVPEDYQGLVYGTHKQIGIIILFLMVLRLMWALINTKPVLAPTTAWWERFLVRTVHFSLYFFVTVMALLGWVAAVLAGYPPKFGNIQFNLPLIENKDLSKYLFSWHTTIAYILIGLVVLHVLAALYHHFIRRDDVLKRMLPGG